MEKYRNDKLINFISNLISKFSEGKKILIVGIEGQSGVGKTTISKILKEIIPNITILHMDDFQENMDNKIYTFKKLTKKSEIYQKGWFNNKKIKETIKNFKKNEKTTVNKILIIDGIFLHNKNIFGNYIDKIIYIKIDEKLLQKRRSCRTKINKLDKKENYTLFSDLLDVAWKNYIEKYKIEEKSDAVIKIK